MNSLMRSVAIGARQGLRQATPASTGALYAAQRNYRHWYQTTPHDFGLPVDSMPFDMDSVFKKDPKEMDLYENYWYWKLRGDATVLDTEALPQKSYKQLARDLGLSVLHEPSEHFVGLLELYEYLKASPYVGPFGTIENPVLVPSINSERNAACTGGTADSEHAPLWFRCREGFLYRCGECDQIFMLVRVDYWDETNGEIFPVDSAVSDAFDGELVKRMNDKWNKEFVVWSEGSAYFDNFSEIHEAMDKGQISFEDVAATVKATAPGTKLTLASVKKTAGISA